MDVAGVPGPFGTNLCRLGDNKDPDFTATMAEATLTSLHLPLDNKAVEI
jgi:hypothetical protein